MKHLSDSNNYCVYVHIVPNGKLYIGITGQKPIYRWDNGNGYKKTPQFWVAIEEYGWDNIQHIILITGLKKEVAKACEIALIDKYHSNNPEYGYNIALGNYHAEESKRKNAFAHIGKQYHLGFKASEESRKRMSDSHKGKKLSEKERIRALECLAKARRDPEIEARRRENIRKSHLGVKRGAWSEQAIAASTQNAQNAINAIKDGNASLIREFGNVETALTAVAGQMQNCCCDVKQQIMQNNYDGAMRDAATNANFTAQIQSVKDMIAQNKIEALQAQVSQLQLAQATSGVLRFPNSWSYDAGVFPPVVTTPAAAAYTVK